MTHWRKENEKWMLLSTDAHLLAKIEKISGTWWGTVPPRTVPHISSDSLSTCMKLTEQFVEGLASLLRGKR